MVDDDLVATVGAEGGLHGLGDGSASIDVANDGAILCVVAKKLLVCVLYIVVWRGNVLLVAWLEQAGVRGSRD